MATASSNTQIQSTARVAYIYDGIADKWYPIAGSVDPTADINWTGTHIFDKSVTMKEVLKANAGVNNFADATVRDAAIPNPVNGAVCFLRDSSQLQYYSGTSWKTYGDNAFLSGKSSSFTIALADSGKTIDAESSSPIVITVPKDTTLAFPNGTQISVIQTGTGQVSFAAEDSTITINSKLSAKKISARYSPATLIKKATNNWILIGDLTV